MEYQKHTFYLRKGDVHHLKEYFPNIGPSKIIRRLVSDFVDKNLMASPSGDDLEKLAVEIEEEEGA